MANGKIPASLINVIRTLNIDNDKYQGKATIFEIGHNGVIVMPLQITTKVDIVAYTSFFYGAIPSEYQSATHNRVVMYDLSGNVHQLQLIGGSIQTIGALSSGLTMSGIAVWSIN